MTTAFSYFSLEADIAEKNWRRDLQDARTWQEAKHDASIALPEWQTQFPTAAIFIRRRVGTKTGPHISQVRLRKETAS